MKPDGPPQKSQELCLSAQPTLCTESIGTTTSDVAIFICFTPSLQLLSADLSLRIERSRPTR